MKRFLRIFIPLVFATGLFAANENVQKDGTGSITQNLHVAGGKTLYIDSTGTLALSSWDRLTGKPTTLAGYGVTNGAAIDIFGANGSAFYLSRANHTGTQLASTISDFSSAVAGFAPVQTVAGRIGNITLTKTDVGLGSVDNTSDASKPISTATQTALDDRVSYSAQSKTAAQQAQAAKNIGVSRSPSEPAYGATGDGTTDDGAALAAFFSSLQDGDVVVFRPGTYKSTQRIATKAKRLTIIGNGAVLKPFITDNPGSDAVNPFIKIGLDHPGNTSISPVSISEGQVSLTAASLPTYATAGNMAIISNLVDARATYTGIPYYDGHIGEIESYSGGTLVIRDPIHKAFTAKNVSVQEASVGTLIYGLEIDLTNSSDITGLYVIGRDCVVDRCRVYSLTGTSDTNRAAVEVLGINNAVSNSTTFGIWNNVNSTTRRGYGVHMSGKNNRIAHCVLYNHKHCAPSGALNFEEEGLTVEDTFLGQDPSLYATVALNGDPLCLWPLDAHDGLTMLSAVRVTIHSPNYGIGIRNGRAVIRDSIVKCMAPSSSYKIGISIFDAAASNVRIVGGEFTGWSVLQNLPGNAAATVNRNIQWQGVTTYNSGSLRFKSGTANDSFEDCSVTFCDFKTASSSVIDFSGWAGTANRISVLFNNFEISASGAQAAMNLAGGSGFSFDNIRFNSNSVKLAGSASNRAIHSAHVASESIGYLEVLDNVLTLANGNVTYGWVFDTGISNLQFKRNRVRPLSGGNTFSTADLYITSYVTSYQEEGNDRKVTYSVTAGLRGETRRGTATLVAGTVTVADAFITANSRIEVSRATTGGTVGHLSSSKVVGTSFTITSSSNTETSTVNYTITEP